MKKDFVTTLIALLGLGLLLAGMGLGFSTQVYASDQGQPAAAIATATPKATSVVQPNRSPGEATPTAAVTPIVIQSNRSPGEAGSSVTLPATGGETASPSAVILAVMLIGIGSLLVAAGLILGRGRKRIR